MGLLVISLVIIGVIGGLLLVLYADIGYLIPALFSTIFIVLACLLIMSNTGTNPSYKYSAVIKQDYYSINIFFDSFTQTDDKILITNYAAGDKIHWLDFKRYDVIESPLTITLTDNDNKFIYYDRVNKVTYNEKSKLNEAIQ